MRLQGPVLLLVSLFFVMSAQSQSNELIVQGQTGKLYLEHTVAARENWYSVGRLYNINPKELATYNHLTFAQPLVTGQALQVPLTAVNFSQDGKKLAAETLVPVIHVVQDKEWLYRISINHNKVPIPALEKWNHVTGDLVHPGLHMIVGYLKVKTALSALAAGAGSPAAAATGKTGTDAPAVAGGKTRTDAPAVARVSAPGKAAMAPSTDSSSPASSGKDSGAAKPVVTGKTFPPHPAMPVTSHPATTATSDQSGNDEVAGSVAVPPSSAPPVPPAPHFNGGKFRAEFTDGGKSATGQAGVFKSSSGWQDGKYYALMNNVAVGTIVKISDPATGKSVYVKVLGQMPDMKESVGLMIRVSNAAAAELGVGEPRFGVGINY